MNESSRLILGLRSRGWTDTEIIDFILYIETGDDKYKPKSKDEEKPKSISLRFPINVLSGEVYEKIKRIIYR